MEKGHTNNPNGRPKGALNKASQEAKDIAERLGCKPFEVLCLFAMGDFAALGYSEYQTKVIGKGAESTTIDELTISPELRQKSARDACKYLHPELRSVEVGTSDEGGAIVFQVAYPDK
jgi:hypothetical protein